MAVCWDTERGTVTPTIHCKLGDLIERYADAAAIGIDIPIGLSDTGTRRCDIEARRVLGRGRASSVFPPPIRDILHEETYEAACAHSRAKIDKAISRQCFAIMPKIAEADAAITPDIQGRVFEVHPEVSFWALAGSPMRHRKGKLRGYNERKTYLERATGHSLPERREAFNCTRPAKPDDLLDAVVAAWTAKRVTDGVAKRLPEEPETDANGLHMEIAY